MRKSIFLVVTIAFAMLLLTGCPGVIKPNTAPGEPLIVSPANGSTDQELTVTLDWSATDPDGDTLKYDLYFADESAALDVAFVSDLSTSEYTIEGAATGTTYHWRVVVKDNRGGVTEGNNWTFTTTDTLPTPEDVIIKESTMLGLMNDFEDRKDESGLPSEYAVNGFLNVLSVFPQMVRTYMGAASIIINDPIFGEFIENRKKAETFSPENLAEGLFDNFLEPENLKSLIPLEMLKKFTSNFNAAGTEYTPIADIQDSFDLLLTGFENAHDDLTNILKVLSMPGYQILLYPNEFDNDKDGSVEPYSELKIAITSVDPETDVATTVSYGLYSEIVMGIINEELSINPGTISSVEIDKTGGDGIFEKDLIFALLGADSNYDGNIVFDENDFVPIDKGDIAAILGIVDVLSIVHTPFVLWDLQPDMDSLDILVTAIATETGDAFFDAIDANSDENLTQEEVRAFAGEDFLTFRNDKSAERLSRIRDLLEELPRVALCIADDLENDSDGRIGITDLLIPVEAAPVIRSYVEEFSPYFSFLHNEPYITETYFSGETEPLSFKPWVLFDSPNNFSDLLSFFPTINDFRYQNGDFSVILPDSTFGGIVENLPRIINHKTDVVEERDFLDCDSPDNAYSLGNLGSNIYESGIGFDSINDTDWFSFNITGSATYFIAALEVENCGLEIYSSDLNLIATGSYISDRADTIQTITKLEPGDYYLKLWNKNTGVENYTISIGSISGLEEDPNEPNNTKETATMIPNIYLYTHASFETGNDIDWYTFTLTETDTLYLETDSDNSMEGYIDPVFYLYDSTGIEIGESYFNRNGESLCVHLEAGQYYIKVISGGNNIGGYRFEDD